LRAPVNIKTNQGKGEEDKQEHKPATKSPGTGKRARGSQQPIGPTPTKAGVRGTSNQGVLNHRRASDHQIITNHNRDWVKALNEPLIMSTAQLRTTGEDHLVETAFVTRGLVSVRMDTRRNIRRGNQNQQQEPTTRTTLIEPLSLSTTPMRSPGRDHLVETGLVTRGLVSVKMDTRRKGRNVGVEDH